MLANAMKTGGYKNEWVDIATFDAFKAEIDSNSVRSSQWQRGMARFCAECTRHGGSGGVQFFSEAAAKGIPCLIISGDRDTAAPTKDARELKASVLRLHNR